MLVYPGIVSINCFVVVNVSNKANTIAGTVKAIIIAACKSSANINAKFLSIVLKLFFFCLASIAVYAGLAADVAAPVVITDGIIWLDIADWMDSTNC